MAKKTKKTTEERNVLLEMFGEGKSIVTVKGEDELRKVTEELHGRGIAFTVGEMPVMKDGKAVCYETAVHISDKEALEQALQELEDHAKTAEE